MPLGYRRAAIGSTNPAKVEAVRLVLERLAPDCALEAVDVPSGVAAQPVGDQATREGARNRALAALVATGAEVSFGLEGGVLTESPVGQSPLVWLVSWVAAVTADGRSGDASGLRMPLPRSVAQRLADGDELGTVIDDLFAVRESKQHAGAVGLLTEGFVSRTDAFADLVAMACAPLLRPDLY
jgi:inosine/xanthosine triphosphatase